MLHGINSVELRCDRMTKLSGYPGTWVTLTLSYKVNYKIMNWWLNNSILSQTVNGFKD